MYNIHQQSAETKLYSTAPKELFLDYDLTLKQTEIPPKCVKKNVELKIKIKNKIFFIVHFSTLN